MVGCPAADRRGGDTDFELMAFGFADGILASARRAENVKHQDVAIPGAKRVHCQTFAPGVAFGLCFRL